MKRILWLLLGLLLAAPAWASEWTKAKDGAGGACTPSQTQACWWLVDASNTGDTDIRNVSHCDAIAMYFHFTTASITVMPQECNEEGGECLDLMSTPITTAGAPVGFWSDGPIHTIRGDVTRTSGSGNIKLVCTQ